ncbi:MAG: hypothetical protein K2L34_15375 [Muribaculaceae bacterium]|nr:hypothetical protein [Muribaculaceae bacterium]
MFTIAKAGTDSRSYHERRKATAYDVRPFRIGPSMLNALEVSPRRTDP